MITMFTLTFLCPSPLSSQGIDIKRKQPQEDQYNPDVYVKIGELTLRFSYLKVYGLFRGRTLIPKENKSSIERPIEVDEMSFLEEIDILEHDRPYTIQYIIKNNKIQGHLPSWLSRIREDLKSKGMDIKDLPVHGSFYKFITSEKYNSAHYISNTDILADPNGDPLVLYLCGRKTNPLKCGVSFDWTPDINVRIRVNEFPENLPRVDSIDTWLTVYPILFQKLNDHIVYSREGAK